MSHALTVVILVLATAALSALLVWKSIALSIRIGMIDQPAPRRAGMPLKARGAGPALFLAFAFGIALTYSLDVVREPKETERLLLLLAGAALITGVTVFDDVIGLSPGPKFGFQLLAAALVTFPRFQGPRHGIVIEQFNVPFGSTVELPVVIAVAFTLFWFVGMMNTINFVDGLDGLAASVTLIACAILFAHTYFWPRQAPQFTISLLAAALGAVLIGFLPFNWYPSKVIMGDAGAYFLGFALAGISIIGGAKIATALLVLGLPILDVAWVIVTRVYRGGSPTLADRGHLHYRLLASGWSQPRVTLFVAAISAAFGAAGVLLPNRGLKLAALFLIGLLLLGIVTALAYREPRTLIESGSQSGQSPVSDSGLPGVS